MDFIVPGLVMMSVIQNSYGNISSSFFGAKFGRHVEEMLVSPMPQLGDPRAATSPARVLRGLMVGVIVLCIAMCFTHVRMHASVGDADDRAARRDDLLARRLRQRGVREEVRRHRDRADLHPDAAHLPRRRVLFGRPAAAVWAETATHLNPILYMVNAFRYGLLGVSDVPMWVAYAVMLGFVVVLAALGLWLLKRGVGLRS